MIRVYEQSPDDLLLATAWKASRRAERMGKIVAAMPLAPKSTPPTPAQARVIAAVRAGAITTHDVADMIGGRSMSAIFRALLSAAEAGVLCRAQVLAKTKTGGSHTAIWWLPGRPRPNPRVIAPQHDAAGKRVLAALDAGHTAVRDIAAAAGVSGEVCRTRLHAMMTAGEVEKIGVTSGARYRRTAKAPDGQVVPPS